MDTPVVAQPNLLNAGAIMWPVFYVVLVICILFSAVYYYHWGRYSPTHFGAIGATVIYTVGLLLLLISLLGIVTTI